MNDEELKAEIKLQEKKRIKAEFAEAMKAAYLEGYSDGNSDGSRTTGCRGCYDHDPINDVEAAWKISDTATDITLTY